MFLLTLVSTVFQIADEADELDDATVNQSPHEVYILQNQLTNRGVHVSIWFKESFRSESNRKFDLIQLGYQVQILTILSQNVIII